jgi:hypothetical protein
MHLDYWHIRRYLTLEGTSEEPLPYGAPPLVVGSVVSLPEPVWRTAVATVVAHGASSVFAGWKWRSPLSTNAAASLLGSLQSTISSVEEARTLTYPNDLGEDDQPDVDTVLTALGAIRDLLALAVQQDKAVVTWND